MTRAAAPMTPMGMSLALLLRPEMRCRTLPRVYQPRYGARKSDTRSVSARRQEEIRAERAGQPGPEYERRNSRGNFASERRNP